jgi:murein DD-endopeptidase MepM/ murein hydrolase activator NlpD
MSIDQTFLAPLPIATSPFNQLESIRGRFEAAQLSEGATRSWELKKATQEFEAVFVNYMLKVLRETINPADEHSGLLGKDVYLSMFDQEISLDIARNHSLGIGEMLFRQLELSLKESDKKQNRELSKLSEETVLTSIPGGAPHSTAGSLAGGSDPAVVDEAQPAAQNGGADWIAPVEGRLSSSFGMRSDPLTQSSSLHRGIDIAAPAGTPIRAAQSGTVIFSGYLRGYGNTIVLEHANGYRTLYGHASKNHVSVGATVSANQIIGEVGSTGRSTGTHLHFELQKRGEKIDPQAILLAGDRWSLD